MDDVKNEIEISRQTIMKSIEEQNHLIQRTFHALTERCEHLKTKPINEKGDFTDSNQGEAHKQ